MLLLKNAHVTCFTVISWFINCRHLPLTSQHGKYRLSSPTTCLYFLSPLPNFNTVIRNSLMFKLIATTALSWPLIARLTKWYTPWPLSWTISYFPRNIFLFVIVTGCFFFFFSQKMWFFFSLKTCMFPSTLQLLISNMSHILRHKVSLLFYFP